ncbi:MAG: aminoglycoside 2-N-acetyltransferase [Cryptosporangiaceae bacterium]|nr:aminoglycoside 2-N-acetyltransferase [Cryptosporangiaceae bacterium]
MTRLQTAHTSDLDPRVLGLARELLYETFAGDLAESDWEHSLGGIHALVWDGGELIGHAAVIQRRLLHSGRAWRAGYVEGVGVHPGRQREGHGGAMMDALGEVIRRAYDLGALGSTDEAERLYAGRGWQRWRGPVSALTPDGIRPTPEEADGIWVLPVTAPLDLDGELTCDWRDADVW